MVKGFFRRDKEKERQRTEQALRKTRQTWFGHVTTLFRRSRIDDELWEELEELLISADVGVATTQKALDRLRERIQREHVTQPDDALEALKSELTAILDIEVDDNLFEVAEPPLVLLVVGVNGAGKTTSIAKLTQMFKEEGKSVVLGAADTFRAAAIEQLQAWGRRLEVDVIAHQSGADPGSVAFDTLNAAKSRGADVVIIDTAGRLHTKLNLMAELKKIQRVLSRQGSGDSQRVLLTLDATTGQNGLLQARSFVEAVKCDGVFLAKLDGTAKGGIVLAIADELEVPVLYVGAGEQPDDIASFNPREFVDSLFADD